LPRKDSTGNSNGNGKEKEGKGKKDKDMDVDEPRSKKLNGKSRDASPNREQSPALRKKTGAKPVSKGKEKAKEEVVDGLRIPEGDVGIWTEHKEHVGGCVNELTIGQLSSVESAECRGAGDWRWGCDD
jgi:hypothetical protein